jgi:hypothetical protein
LGHLEGRVAGLDPLPGFLVVREGPGPRALAQHLVEHTAERGLAEPRFGPHRIPRGGGSPRQLLLDALDLPFLRPVNDPSEERCKP